MKIKMAKFDSGEKIIRLLVMEDNDYNVTIYLTDEKGRPRLSLVNFYTGCGKLEISVYRDDGTRFQVSQMEMSELQIGD